MSTYGKKVSLCILEKYCKVLNLTLYNPGRSSLVIQLVDASDGLTRDHFLTLPSAFVCAVAIADEEGVDR